MTPLHHYRSAVKARLQAELSNLQERISNGVCPDYAAYREMAGRCKQLRADIGTLDEELKKVQEEDDE